jgi:hypothetical protein
MANMRDSALARSNLLKALQDNLDPKARVVQKITQDSFFQQAPITKSQMDKVFGTEDEFLERYGRFQKDYEAAIGNKLNHAKGAKVNVELMKRQGKTDLSVLNRETADKLYKSIVFIVLSSLILFLKFIFIKSNQCLISFHSNSIILKSLP